MAELGLYAPSGTYGDATLATAAKGELLTEGLLRMILSDRLAGERIGAIGEEGSAMAELVVLGGTGGTVA